LEDIDTNNIKIINYVDKEYIKLFSSFMDDIKLNFRNVLAKSNFIAKNKLFIQNKKFILKDFLEKLYK
jgi:hypothetical protein